MLKKGVFGASQKGATWVEYGAIVGFVSVLAIGSLAGMGVNISTLFGSAASQVTVAENQTGSGTNPGSGQPPVSPPPPPPAEPVEPYEVTWTETLSVVPIALPADPEEQTSVFSFGERYDSETQSVIVAGQDTPILFSSADMPSMISAYTIPFLHPTDSISFVEGRVTGTATRPSSTIDLDPAATSPRNVTMRLTAMCGSRVFWNFAPTFTRSGANASSYSGPRQAPAC